VTTVQDLGTKLQAAGLGVQGTTIFGSLNAIIPAGAGPFVHLVEYGGAPPGETHDDPGTAIDRPRVQVSVHAASYAVADAHAQACHRELSRIVNALINSTFYVRVVPLQQPFDLGPDASNRATVAFNVACDKGVG
jgi:minor capsid protein